MTDEIDTSEWTDEEREAELARASARAEEHGAALAFRALDEMMVQGYLMVTRDEKSVVLQFQDDGGNQEAFMLRATDFDRVVERAKAE